MLSKRHSELSAAESKSLSQRCKFTLPIPRLMVQM
jgi:hypothetical protein